MATYLIQHNAKMDTIFANSENGKTSNTKQ